MKKKKGHLKELTLLGHRILSDYYQKYKRGELSEAQAKKQALAQLNPFRYDDGIGYFWLIDTKKPVPNMVLHPIFPERNGAPVNDVYFNPLTKRSSILGVDLVDAALKNKEGSFYTYYWPKPKKGGGTSSVQERISYLMLFPEWQWIIATGVYLDDIETATEQRMQSVLGELRKVILETKIAKSGYLFIVDKDGKVVLHPTVPSGQRFDQVNVQTGNRVFDELVKSYNEGKPYHYLWTSPFDTQNYTYKKIAFIRHYKPLDWYLVSSIYEDEIFIQQREVVTQILFYSIFIFIFVLAFSWFLLERLIAPLKVLITSVTNINKDNFVRTYVPELGFTETKLLGKTINEMCLTIREMIFEIEKSRKEAELASSAKTMFLATISHEIRTPLNAILGFSDVLRTKIENEEHIGFLKRIRDSGDSLLQTINNVLDISVIERGQLELIESDFNLKEIFLRMAKIFELKAAEHSGVEFIYEYQEGLPEYYKGNPVWMNQIFLNFLSNAFKFTPSGKILFKLERGGHPLELKLTVKDTGVGISKENIQKVLRPFEQEDNTISRKYGGTGLGLYIVKNYIEKMGGRFEINSDKDQGTECIAYFMLPLMRNEEILKIQKEESQKGTVRFTNILVVDDSEDNCILMGHLLKNCFDHIDYAENGQVACEKVFSKEYDFVLMDIQMPVMDGYEALKFIREEEKRLNRKRTMIISLTAHAFNEEREKSLRSGFDAYISKPVKKETILKEMLRILK